MSDAASDTGRTRPTPLAHPAALAAVALLLVNDHLLKARWPGWVTGKLSDVAGMVFFPLLLFAVAAGAARIARRSGGDSRALLVGCAVATALAFAAVKTWEPARAAFEVALGAARWPLGAARAILDGAALPPLAQAAVARDMTDLVALPFVAVAVAIGWPRADRAECR